MYQNDRMVNASSSNPRLLAKSATKNLSPMHFESLLPSAHSHCKAMPWMAALGGLSQAGALSAKPEMHATVTGTIGTYLSCHRMGHPTLMAVHGV